MIGVSRPVAPSPARIFSDVLPVGARPGQAPVVIPAKAGIHERPMVPRQRHAGDHGCGTQSVSPSHIAMPTRHCERSAAIPSEARQSRAITVIARRRVVLPSHMATPTRHCERSAAIPSAYGHRTPRRCVAVAYGDAHTSLRAKRGNPERSAAIPSAYGHRTPPRCVAVAAQ